jgi:hypothetical protein
MSNGTVFVVEHPDLGAKFIGYTERDLVSRLIQLRSQKGNEPICVWIRSLGEDRFLLTIRPLIENCPRSEKVERVRNLVIKYATAGAQLLNDRCNKRVHRGTGSPIAAEPTFIYCLRHPIAKEVRYVGKTVDIKAREKSHRQLGKTRCDNWKRSLLKDGLWPEMEVLETVPVGANWPERESHWIAHFKEQGANLTNLTDGGEGTHGRVITDAYREKLRKAFTGRHIPQEQREQISKSLTGLKQSEETVEKRLATWAKRREESGKPPLQRYKTPEDYRKSKHPVWYNVVRAQKRRENGQMVMGSEEWKRNAAKKQRAWYASLSDEQKEANAAKHRGKPTNTGKKFGPQSPERRAAQSVRLKAYIASLTPEQREARMAPARRAQPAAWKEICAAKTKDERRAMLAAANAVNPIMHARQEATP